MASIFPSPIITAAFGTIVVALTLGAAQLAVGGDLKHNRQVIEEPASGINRAAKADRMVGLPAQTLPSQTVAVHLQGAGGSSILVRIPAAAVGESRSSRVPFKAPQSTGKTAIACEPVVSVLSEVAKLLEPGRCVT